MHSHAQRGNEGIIYFYKLYDNTFPAIAKTHNPTIVRIV